MKKLTFHTLSLLIVLFAVSILSVTQSPLLHGQAGIFAGTWEGTWMSGFGSGAVSLDVTVSDDEGVAATLNLTGVIFGIPGPHGPFLMTGTFNPDAGITLTDPDNPLYGPLTIVIDADGKATANAPNVPGDLIQSATGTGELNALSFTGSGMGSPTPDFGGQADSTLMIELTEPTNQPPSKSVLFAQVGEGTVGDLSFSTLFAIDNTNSQGSAVQLQFYSSPNGDPMEVTLMGRGTDSSFFFILDPGETLFLQTPGTTEPIQVGYAQLLVPEGVDGTAIFTRVEGGTTVTKAGVPSSQMITDFTSPVDTRGANDLGLALVNPPGIGLAGSEPANVTVRLYDSDFNLMGTQELLMTQGAHMAAFVTQDVLFGDVEGVDEMTGSLTVDSDKPIAAAVLLQDDNPGLVFPADVPILTAFPVVEGRADREAPAAAASRIRGSQVQLRLALPEGRTVRGAIYRIYMGDRVVGRALRQTPSSGEIVETFTLPTGVDTSRFSATVQFIYADGSESEESPLSESDLARLR